MIIEPNTSLHVRTEEVFALPGARPVIIPVAGRGPRRVLYSH